MGETYPLILFASYSTTRSRMLSLVNSTCLWVMSYCCVSFHIFPVSLIFPQSVVGCFLPEMSVSYREEEDYCNVLPNKSCAVRGDCNFKLC